GQVLERGQRASRGDLREVEEGIGPLAGDNGAAMYGLKRGGTAYFGSRRSAGASGARFGLMVHGTKGVLDITTGGLPAIHFLPDPAWAPGRTCAKWVPVTSVGVGQPEPLQDGGLHMGNVL